VRRWNWVALLHAEVEAAKLRPFDYGEQNCGLFAAQCIDAIVVGSARVAELKTQFHDEASARAFVEAAGSIEAAVTQRLGEPKPWWKARRGDVCLLPTPDGPGLGVCVGDMVAMMSLTGIAYFKMDLATAAWSVD